MKKYIYILIALTVISLSGCSKEEKMPDYIPTGLSEEGDISETDADDSGDLSDTDEDITKSDDGDQKDGDLPDDSQGDDNSDTQPVTIGKTATMYVKLSQYGGYLNIRSNPSTDSEPVGFLVHAEAVDVIEIKNGWASILYKGKVCYVNADFLVDKQPEFLDPPTATPTPKAAAKPTAAPKPAAAAKPENKTKPEDKTKPAATPIPLPEEEPDNNNI